jgi:beta-lactamase superfamily II metal-dependent hydrolase
MRARSFLIALAAWSGAFWTTAARADQLVVQRNVTVREEPRRASDVVDFPAVGTRLELLDGGARRSGYYHVRLPDGREGWVYQTFVRRVEVAGPGGPGGERIAVHYIDVEQGAAAVVETPCGAVMIDAGGRGDAAGDHLIEYLDAFFERRQDLGRRLAALFVTHTHIDHNSNLRRVAERYDVAGYVHNGRMVGSGRNGARWMVDHAGSRNPAIPTLSIEDVAAAGVTNAVVDPLACTGTDPRIRVFAGGLTQNPGWSASEFDNGNNHSLVIRVDYGESSFLFTGDLEDHAIERLVDRSAAALDVDVYEAGHHGSLNGTTAGLRGAMTPDIAIISMGPHTVQRMWTAWAYGHPRRTLVELLDSAVARPRIAPKTVMVADRVKSFSTYDLTDAIYATGWDGDVVVTGTADGQLQVSTSR